MFENEEIILIEDFINKIKEKDGIEFAYTIKEPEIVTKDYFDSKSKTIKPIDISIQKINIELYKNTIKKSFLGGNNVKDKR